MDRGVAPAALQGFHIARSGDVAVSALGVPDPYHAIDAGWNWRGVVLPPKHDSLPVVGDLGEKVSNFIGEAIRDVGVVFEDHYGLDLVHEAVLEYSEVAHSASIGAAPLRKFGWYADGVAVDGFVDYWGLKWPVVLAEAGVKGAKSIGAAWQVDNVDAFGEVF
jgi:hypothetical protein